jgi:hypothetical protein
MVKLSSVEYWSLSSEVSLGKTFSSINSIECGAIALQFMTYEIVIIFKDVPKAEISVSEGKRNQSYYVTLAGDSRY